MRANRIGTVTGELRFLSETNLERIEAVIDQEKPQIVVIDSIQTMYREEITSAPGSVSQVRESTGVLMQIAKSRGIAIFVVGHVTKEGVVAGPRVLEHMVDTVLYFEGDRNAVYRILRSVKNRFGSTNEIGVFEMGEEGLAEVENPSEYMLDAGQRKLQGQWFPAPLKEQAYIAGSAGFGGRDQFWYAKKNRCRYRLQPCKPFNGSAGKKVPV